MGAERVAGRSPQMQAGPLTGMDRRAQDLGTGVVGFTRGDHAQAEETLRFCRRVQGCGKTWAPSEAGGWEGHLGSLPKFSRFSRPHTSGVPVAPGNLPWPQRLCQFPNLSSSPAAFGVNFPDCAFPPVGSAKDRMSFNSSEIESARVPRTCGCACVDCTI